MIAHLEHAAVTVRDLEWSIRFFAEVLGMQVTRRKEQDGVLQQVWLDGGLQLIASPENHRAGQGHHLGIVVEDFQQALQEMLACEGVHSMPGKPEKWVELPDGLVLELFQARTEALKTLKSLALK